MTKRPMMDENSNSEMASSQSQVDLLNKSISLLEECIALSPQFEHIKFLKNSILVQREVLQVIQHDPTDSTSVGAKLRKLEATPKDKSKSLSKEEVAFLIEYKSSSLTTDKPVNKKSLVS